MSLFAELKRRNVFRVGAAYAVVAWLLLQVGDVAADNLGFPGWFMPMLFVLLGLGFPVALVLSWAFDLTPEGIKRTEDVDSGSAKPSLGLGDGLLIALLLFVGGAIVYQAMHRDEPPAQHAESTAATAAPAESSPVPALSAPDQASIAVLPFIDLSATGDQAYFSEGIAEEILNVLAGIEGLRVASRTSSFLFKNENKSIPVIAETLGVAHVLEGSVRKAGDRVRITAQLIGAGSDAHLWSETYDRELSTENLFAIQDEIANAIVDALRTSMSLSAEAPASVVPSTDNLDAYELLLQARTVGMVMSTDSRQRELVLLEQAVELDPEFAEAWARLAAVLAHLPTWDHTLDQDAYRLRAIAAAQRALELEPASAEAWRALRFAYFYLHQWEQADEIAAQARQVVPGFEIAAVDYLALGYLGKALARAEEQIATETVMPAFWHLIKGLSLEAMGRHEEAIGPIETAMLGGYQGSAPETLADIYLDLGRSDVWLMQHSSYYREHDPELLPLLPHLLQLDLDYRAGDPGAGSRFMAIAQEMGFTIDELVVPGPLWGLRVPYTAASALGRDEEIAERYWSHSPKFWMWTPTLKQFRRSEPFKQRVRESGMLAYWQSHGWPDKCRPLGEDDFICD